MSDDDKKTPRGKGLRVPTEGERQAFAAQWTSGVPAVGQFDDQEDTSPIDLFRRPPRPASRDLVAELRRHPEKLIPFLGEFAEWVTAKMRERSSSEQSQMAELRELLNRPPNGAMQRLAEQVEGLSEAVSELAARMDAVERQIEKIDERVSPVEETIKAVKGSSWKVALTISTTIAGSAVAVVATMNAKAAQEGAMAERVLTIQRDITELKSWRYGQSGRRDYDFDITPRPMVAPKKEP